METKIFEDSELEEWIKKAIVFDFGECPIHKRPIKIEERKQLDNSRKWVLKMHEWVLGKDGEFYYEPLPSNRSDEFIEGTRFDSPKECYLFWIGNVRSVKNLNRNRRGLNH